MERQDRLKVIFKIIDRLDVILLKNHDESTLAHFR